MNLFTYKIDTNREKILRKIPIGRKNGLNLLIHPNQKYIKPYSD